MAARGTFAVPSRSHRLALETCRPLDSHQGEVAIMLKLSARRAGRQQLASATEMSLARPMPVDSGLAPMHEGRVPEAR